MSASDGFLAFVEEQLAQVCDVSHKRMFGGVGLYADGIFFAIIDDDELYFKVDDTTLPKYEERGMDFFRPYGDERTMSYCQVPAEVLEDTQALSAWVSEAVEVSLRKKAKKRKR